MVARPKTRLVGRDKVRLLRSWLNYLHSQSTPKTEVKLVCAWIELVTAVLNDTVVKFSEEDPALKLILKKDPKQKAAIWDFISVSTSESGSGPKA